MEEKKRGRPVTAKVTEGPAVQLQITEEMKSYVTNTHNSYTETISRIRAELKLDLENLKTNNKELHKEIAKLQEQVHWNGKIAEKKNEKIEALTDKGNANNDNIAKLLQCNKEIHEHVQYITDVSCANMSSMRIVIVIGVVAIGLLGTLLYRLLTLM